MQLTINVPDEITLQAEAQGLGPESYAERLIREDLARAASASTRDRARSAVEEIRRLRKGVRLDGLSIRELVNEGRKH